MKKISSQSKLNFKSHFKSNFKSHLNLNAKYILTLKTLLKSHRITYAALAEEVNMSESGVKKIFSGSDISLYRLNQICEVLGLSLGQLCELTEKKPIKEVRLSQKQEEALLKDRQLLAVYWLFAIDKKSIEQISNILKLNQVDVKKYLQKCVSLDLLKQKKGQFNSVITGKYRWPDDSRIAAMLNKEWSLLVLQRGLKKLNHHRLMTSPMSVVTYKEFNDKLNSLFDETVRKAADDELKYQEKDLLSVSAIFAITDLGLFDS